MATERLQKIISGYGVASRRAAERLINERRVRVNGEIATLGMSADPNNDLIEVDGKSLDRKPDAIYIVLNKPRGYITTSSDERGRKTVLDIVNCGARVYPIGRLDLGSEGLLILTNDGEAARFLTHPSVEISKTYRVTVENADTATIEKLRDIDNLDGEKINPPSVTEIDGEGTRRRLEITIHEGKNRQIRRMCEACGMEVLRLKRIRVGEINLGRLKPGEWRHMEKQEVRYIQGLTKEHKEGH